MVLNQLFGSDVPLKLRDDFGYGPFMGPTGGRHLSDNINAGIGNAVISGMCNWTVNRGVIWTILMDIVLDGLLTEQRLMFMS